MTPASISHYNPGRLSDDEARALFIARRPLFDRIMADVVAEPSDSRAQHHLIIGQRGMGKTTLLTRIRAELNLTEELKLRYLPLVFAEEQYAVDRLSKFWLNCLDSLADALDHCGGQQPQVDAIDQQVAQLHSQLVNNAKNDAPLAAEALAAFLAAAAATRRRPVLLVDNLQLVFERLDSDAQHALRELLMRPGCPILIGTSTSPLPEGQNYGAAFYDHFKVHHLRALDLDEMKNVILQLAALQQRDNVRQIILEHPERLAVLRHLTGGNPRTTTIIYSLYAENFSSSVYRDLEDLLDRVTPLYKARFEELPAQQQIVAGAIANFWDPVTGRQLTGLTGLAVNQISPQLDRLEKSGFIEKTELSGESSAGYLISERFFNIWFLMRNASRRQRREVEYLTRFLQSFYDSGERRQIARSVLGECNFSPDRYTFSLALAESVDDQHTAESVRRHAQLDVLRQNARAASQRFAELIDLAALPSATLDFHQLREKLVRLVPAEVDVTPELFADEILADVATFRSGDRQTLANIAPPLSMDQFHTIREAMAESRKWVIENSSESAVAWVSHQLASGQIRSFYDLEDWNRGFCQVEDAETCALMLDMLYGSDLGEKLDEKAIIKIRYCLQPSSQDSAAKWRHWADRLYRSLKRFDEAETACREAIARDPKVASTWINLGLLLHQHRKHYVEAENAYREAISHDPKDARPWNILGILLTYDLQRFAEAETAFHEAIVRDPKDAMPWNSLGNLYTDFLNQPQDAANAFAKCLELDPNNECAHENLIFLHRDFLGEGSEAKAWLASLETRSNLKLLDILHLHRALFAAYDANWGIASESLSAALERIQDGFPPVTQDDWMRASAVLLHLNYGAELIALLKQRGDDLRLRPWYEALQALLPGDKTRLQNVAPEIRSVAEKIYDSIERRLNTLPENTRRRPRPATAKSARGKK